MAGLGNKSLKVLQHEKFSDVLFDASNRTLKNGKIFYVDSATGSDSYGGERIDSPFATLAKAASSVANSRGDYVYILSTHSETLGATPVLLSKKSVKYKGLKSSNTLPIFYFEHVDANILIGGNDCSFDDIQLIPTVDSVVSALTVSGDNIKVDVVAQESSDLVEFKTPITCNLATGSKIKLKYNGRTGGDACENAIRLINCNDIDVDIDHTGKASIGSVEFKTTASTDVKVSGYIYNNAAADGSLDIVNTGGLACTWFGRVEDGRVGGMMSGGSGQAWASDDVSTLTANVAAIQTDLGNPSARTNLQTIEAMLGNPDVSGMTIYAAIGGAAGLNPYPGAAAAADNVSVAEVVRYVQENQIGTLANTGGTATLGGIIGDVSNSSIATRLTNIASAVDAVDNFVDTEVADIKTKTDQIGTVANTGGTATLAAVIGDPSNISIVSRLTTIDDFLDTEVADIKTETDQIGTVANTGGTATLAAAVGDVANNSIAARLTDLNSDIGTLTNTGGTATVGAILGDVANVAVATRLGNISAETDQIGTVVNTGGTATVGAVLGDFANVTAVTKFGNIQTEVNKVGTITNTGGTATIGAVLGDVANVAVVTRLGTIQTETDQIGTVVNTGGTATLAGALGDVANVTVASRLTSIKTETDQIGTIVNTGGTATVAGVLGDFANVTAVTKFANIQTEVDKIGTIVNTGGTAKIGDLFGDMANSPAVTRFGNIQNSLNQIQYASGTFLVVKKTLTSSAIVTGGVDITAASTDGKLLLRDIHINTDLTGLAAGTNFEIRNNNANGVALIFSETVAALGANATESLATGSVAAVSGITLETGKKLTAYSTGINCTGAGTITIELLFQRVDGGAQVAAA